MTKKEKEGIHKAKAARSNCLCDSVIIFKKMYLHCDTILITRCDMHLIN